jgi:DNA-directed RNA polymerase specialized sigma24 family protein
MSFFAGRSVAALNRTRLQGKRMSVPTRPISTATRAFEMTTVSTIGYSTTGSEPAAATLSVAEADAAIRSLGEADKIALHKIARLHAKKTPYDHEDLLQEALCRVLCGKRAWPRELAALPFLCGVVRSISWEWRREIPDTLPEGGDPEGEERRAIASLDVAKILALFDDDPAAQIIVRGMMEGARGQELQDLSGLDKTDYESKRTKIRRRVEKAIG